MALTHSYELYERLESLELLSCKPEYWWPGYGTFEVVVGAILTQNANWNRVVVSLENLRFHGLLKLETMLTCKEQLLLECIRPSGLYQSKMGYLKQLSQQMTECFEDFEGFTCNVDREWLLRQKGIGKESADSILCYACKRNVMVVDAYTHRLLAALGYEFEDYDDLQVWFETDSAKMAAHFHGMIVEYVKKYREKNTVSLDALGF